MSAKQKKYQSRPCCGHATQTAWKVCPYCAKKLPKLVAVVRDGGDGWVPCPKCRKHYRAKTDSTHPGSAECIASQERRDRSRARAERAYERQRAWLASAEGKRKQAENEREWKAEAKEQKKRDAEFKQRCIAAAEEDERRERIAHAARRDEAVRAYAAREPGAEMPRKAWLKLMRGYKP